jgi:hypothetical protein
MKLDQKAKKVFHFFLFRPALSMPSKKHVFFFKKKQKQKQKLKN